MNPGSPERLHQLVVETQAKLASAEARCTLLTGLLRRARTWIGGDKIADKIQEEIAAALSDPPDLLAPLSHSNPGLERKPEPEAAL